MRRLFHAVAVIAVVAGSAMVAPVSSHAQGKPPAVKQLAPGIYSIFWGFYNSLVVVTSEGVIITDPAYDVRAKVLKKAIAKLTDKPVTHIILTHEHYDHVGGTGVFPDAKIVCHRACMDVFRLDPNPGRSPKRVDITYKDKLVLNRGGKLIELRYFGRADGAGMSVIVLPRERIIVTADLYAPGYVTPGKWMEDKNYLGTRNILNWIVKQKPKMTMEAHHTNFDPKVVEANAAFVNDLYAAVSARMQATMKKGGPRAVIALIDTLPNELKLPKYKDWKGYKAHLPAHVRRMMLAIFHGG